jgi:hypothetical protein
MIKSAFRENIGGIYKSQKIWIKKLVSDTS